MFRFHELTLKNNCLIEIIKQKDIFTKQVFEGVKVFGSTLGDLRHGAAFALPGVGIFVNPKDTKNIDLLRHEFGHILQAKIWGYKFFYGTVVLESIRSASRANKDSTFIHQHTWTEWTANWLAYNYFNSPSDWNTKKYPISPQGNQATKFDPNILLKQLQAIKDITSRLNS